MTKLIAKLLKKKPAQDANSEEQILQAALVMRMQKVMQARAAQSANG